MSTVESHPSNRRRTILVIAFFAVAALLGAVLIIQGGPRYAPPPQPWAAQGFAAPRAAPQSAKPSPAVTPLAPAEPTRIRIPVIGVNAPLTGLSLLPDGRLAAPPEADRNLAGWYQAGIVPGAAGTAVIAGHVDNSQGPAVFYNLGVLKKGWTIDVDRADHITAVFTIDAVQAYAASDFPTQQVYGQTADAELRLITCGAGFDRSRQEYLGNVVVFAHLTGSTQH